MEEEDLSTMHANMTGPTGTTPGGRGSNRARFGHMLSA